MPWPRAGHSWRPSSHPCKQAHDALTRAGHSPEVVKCYGFAALPDVTRARRKVRRLTGQSAVPVLVLHDGEAIVHCDNIATWARENPASPGGG